MKTTITSSAADTQRSAADTANNALSGGATNASSRQHQQFQRGASNPINSRTQGIANLYTPSFAVEISCLEQDKQRIKSQQKSIQKQAYSTHESTPKYLSSRAVMKIHLTPSLSLLFYCFVLLFYPFVLLFYPF